MTAVSTVMMNAAEAEEVTRRIQNAGTVLGALLVEAYEREAWKALGYKSWKVYVEDRFAFTRQRSYQLMSQERVNKRLAEAGSDLRVTDLEAREVSTYVDTREITHKVEDIRAPLKDKKVRRGPPSITSWLADFRADIERMETALDGAGEEALDYLSGEDRRDLERTADKCWTFWNEIIERLQRPAVKREVDEWVSA